MSNKKLYWWKSIVSMGVILGSMPMVHLVARVLKDNYDGTQLLGAGMAVGFDNPYYFSKCFKAQYGMPPSLYIKQEQAKE